MLTHEYSYETCLDGSVKNAWTVDDCFRGRDFDFTKPFLPDRIAGVRTWAYIAHRADWLADPATGCKM
jgi:ATP-dependent RNA helicase SUPV3L1/SUV3